MFNLCEKYEVDRRILKCDYIRYSPSEISTINTANSQTFKHIPREDSVISLLNGYLDLYFDEVHAATNNRYADGNDNRLVNLGPVALFSNYKLATSSGKHLEDVSHAHIVSLMYKLITTAEDMNDLSIGFDRDRTRRRNELTTNKNIKGKYHLRIIFKDKFSFNEYQEKATFGLGYRVRLIRASVNAVLNKADAPNLGKVKIMAIEWYVPHYTVSMSQQAVLSNQIVYRIPTELQYIERSVFMKEVNTQNLWIFELGTQESIIVPIWIIVGFQQSDRQNSQNVNKDTFCRPPVMSAQCKYWNRKTP